jgi:uncharacterized protein YndB with AHSA1/START domain
MATAEKIMVTVETILHAPVEKVWNLWTDPRHILHWNNAYDGWYTPRAENDLQVGGRFLCRMESRDGKHGFDYSGIYKKVVLNRQIFFTLDDGREVRINFKSVEDQTILIETFEAENLNMVEVQQEGWQAILNSFKKYVEEYGRLLLLHFNISIDAPVEKVYRTVLDEKGYAEWTAVFNPSSHFQGSWKKGSKIRFLGTDQNGTMGGMVSLIRENLPNKFISIEHRGIIKEGKVIMRGPETEEWAGGLENYTFKELNGKTLFLVDVDANHKFKSYFEHTWPKALNKLKTMCEAN